MADQATKRGRGRPRSDDAKTGAERQALYAKARQRDMAKVAYALKDALARTKANQKAFTNSYCGTTSGLRLRQGLARLLNDKATDDPVEQETMKAALAFFDALQHTTCKLGHAFLYEGRRN